MKRFAVPTMRITLIVIAVVLLTGCGLLGGGGGGDEPPVDQPTAQPLDTQPTPVPQEGGEEQVEPAPTSELEPPSPESKLAPGTVLVDQTVSTQQAASSARWSFETPARQVIRVDAVVLEGTPTYRLQIIDKFENTIADVEVGGGSEAGAIAEFTLPYQGSYQVGFVPVEGTGTLQLTVTALDAASGGQDLSGTGASASAAMNVANVFHVYAFPLAEGEVVEIGAYAEAVGAPDTRLAVYGPNGQLAAVADDVTVPDNYNAVLDIFVAPLEGTYQAIVSNLGGTTGPYTFSVDSASVPPQASGEPDIAYGKEYRLQLFEDSVLEVSFDGEVGDVISIQTFDVGNDLDVDIRLYSPFGQVIAYALDASYGESEQLNEIQLPYTGRYLLEMTPFGQGESTFRLELLDDSVLSGGGVFGDEPSGSRSGRFIRENVFHVYQFNAAAGDRITLDVVSQSLVDELDPGLALIAPDGRQAAFADNSDTVTNPLDPALVQFELTQTGIYTIVVYNFNRTAQGTYTLNYLRE